VNPFLSRARLPAALMLAGALSACISVFPKEPPALLYRFGDTPAPKVGPGPQGRFPVLLAAMGFDKASASDRILTVTGNQAAYIKGSRWATPAVTMFEQALDHAFDADAGGARLVVRGEMGRPDLVLRVDVRTFEARYDQGTTAPPTVTVHVRASLTKFSDRVLAGERIFSARVPASDNRVGAIATAYDEAVGKVVGEMVAWVDAKGAG
jgi:cholesterol transport system auxiliary component